MIRPGQRGAKKGADQDGDRLVCVRYRLDEVRKKRVKTVEVSVEAWSWTPPPPRRAGDQIVWVQSAFPEKMLRQQVKDTGGAGHPDKQAWEMRYDRAIVLGLTQRIMDDISC